uniref:G-protein coupled receptors family 1 profile domain-containing protein n=1 Tax=Canis lupus familiaris TaxID=9615 RepID=A0A8I3PID8_CANLF
MSVQSDSKVSNFTFLLTGFPGLEQEYPWLSIPFSCIYAMVLSGNCLVLHVIRTEPSLHQPMFYFLAMLALTDLYIALSTCILPKMLGIFWFHLPDIYFDACLFQMWLIHTLPIHESGILLAMALDRYVAICDPLRHASIFTHKLLTQIGVGVTLRAALLVAPCLILIKCRLKHFRTTVVSHSYCEHMAIVKSMVSLWPSLILGFDIIFITLSYILIFITPSNTCIAHICVFLEFYLLGFLLLLYTQVWVPYSTLHSYSSVQPLPACPSFAQSYSVGVKTKQIRDRVVQGFPL